MSLLKDLYRNQTNIDFRPVWRRSILFSGSLVLITIILLLVRGLNLSIDFRGGGVWQVPVGDGVTVAEGREAAGLPDARVQIVSDPSGNKYIRVQSGSEAVTQSASVVEGLAKLGNVTPDEVSVSTVGPTWGSQITAKALRALILFFIAVAAYLAWRLEWQMAAGAIVAVIHDLGITAGVYALFGFEVSPATVIALLTILGFSLYDTVVVYDKVLDNQKSPLVDKMSPADLVNRSMNQVLMRSLNTTITTVLPVLSMLVIGGVLLGGTTLEDFALALFIGLMLGTYSSIFVAAPMLVWLKSRNAKPVEASRKKSAAARKAAPSGAGAGTAATNGAADDDLVDSVSGARNGSGRPALAAETMFEARPRKQRRKR